jgi:acyl-CoA thioester hydrolase
VDEHRWFTHRIRVRYSETDQMGVVYHTNYLNWFELGRTEMIRELGYPYSAIEAQGLFLPVVEAEIKFRGPARYDDEIEIYTRVASFTNVRIAFVCEIRRVDALGSDAAGTLLVSGLTRHVWVNRSWKPARLDKELPELLQLLSTQR